MGVLQAQQIDTEKLLSLIYQAGGQIKIEGGQLFVSPVEIAQRFGDQIRELKPEIIIAFGHCPICAGELTVRIEERGNRPGRHAHCSEKQHYDSWWFAGEV